MGNKIIQKLKDSELTGRGGGCFNTAEKWSMVKQAKAEKKYVICNASEGEPGVKKDWHILTHHAGRVIDGMKIAMDFLRAKEGIIYLNPDYYFKLKDRLTGIINEAPIKIFHKPHRAGYCGGEETSALNTIEGKRSEPRLRPPYPPTHGLYGQPTLVNNVETLYAVSLIARDEYKKKRFYTLNGDIINNGVYEFPESWTMETVLKETDNWPDFDFFVQAGGDASGEILNQSQLKQTVPGSASITVYSMIKYDPITLIRGWIDFFALESCGKCTPCREGTYRLREILNNKEPDWKMFGSILNTLNDTAFCGLGCVVPNAVRSYVKNVLSIHSYNKINLPAEARKQICECFK